MRNTITEMKNTLEGFNSRLGEAEDRISKLEDNRIYSIRTTTTKNNF